MICRDGAAIILQTGIQLGFGARQGAKMREGDGRTPEGHYHISSRNPQSRFHLALGISYPNARDAHIAYRAGIIDAITLKRICENPARPPWDTPLGGFIMIHGQPAGGAQSGDWTAGCIALPNDAMTALFEIAAIGDAVDIYR